MNTSQEPPFSLIKQPSAWIPMVISLAALTWIAVYMALVGVSQSQATDEGAPARIFQCVMLAQLPVSGYFALKWLPKRPIPALVILALQAAAWVTPILVITWLEFNR
jgi:hypothetical protein